MLINQMFVQNISKDTYIFENLDNIKYSLLSVNFSTHFHSQFYQQIPE